MAKDAGAPTAPPGPVAALQMTTQESEAARRQREARRRVSPGVFYSPFGERGKTFYENVAEADDSPYVAMAVDECHNRPIPEEFYFPDRNWCPASAPADARYKQFLDALNVTAGAAADARDWRLNRLIDMAHVLGILIRYARENPGIPLIGRRETRPDGDEFVGQMESRGGTHWVTHVRCDPLPDGTTYTMSIFGQARRLQGRFRELTDRVMPTAPRELHMPGLTRIAAESENPLEWDDATLKALGDVPGELVRWGRTSCVRSRAADGANVHVEKTTRPGASSSRSREVKPRRGPHRSKADHVRELLSGEAPYEKNKSELSAEVGYTHPSSLASVKNFQNLWLENERKLAAAQAVRAKRMVSAHG